MGLGAGVAAAAGLGAAGSVASGIIGSNASKSAAQTQAAAAEQGTDLLSNIYQQNTARLQPFVSAGQNALGTLQGELPSLTAPESTTFAPTIANLEQTPGYQFTKSQGLLATQNALAGSQPGGAALKSGINYAEGLASTTYQQQFANWQQEFQNYLGQNQQIYGMLSGVSGIGANAAAQTGQQANTSGAGIVNTLTGGAAATAAGTIGSANAIGNATNSVGNSLSNAIGLSAISNLFGAGGSSSNALSSAGIDPTVISTLNSAGSGALPI